MSDDQYKKIEDALKIAWDYGQFDGGHHKMWVIDQMVRALTGDTYEQWVEDYSEPDDDSDYQYEWDTGIAP